MNGKKAKDSGRKKYGICFYLAAISSLVCVLFFLCINYFDLICSVLQKKTVWFLIAFLVVCVLTARFTPVTKWLRNIFAGERLTNTEKLYLLLCGLIYLIWAVAFLHSAYGPDEMMRYDIPRYIYENKALPYGDEEIIRNPIWGISYGFLITLPTVLSAIFMKIMAIFTTDPIMLLIAARLVSVFSTMGTAYYAIQITKKIFRTPVRWVFIVLMTMIPQIVFLSSYVNNDAFGLFTAMMILYAWIRGLESKWDMSSCIFLAIAAGLCLVGYTWYWTFVLCSFFVYCATYFRYRKDGFTTRRFFRYGFLIIGVALLVCGWIYLRAAIIYDGDILGTAHSAAVSELYASEGYSVSQIAEKALCKNGVTVWQMLFEKYWLRATFKSLFSTFGYLSIWAERWIYVFYGSLCMIGTFGIVIQILNGKHVWQQQKKRSISTTGRELYSWLVFLICCAASGAITFLFSIWRSWTGDYQSQGRYILAITPFLFLMIAYAVETIIGVFEKVMERDLTKYKKLISACIIAVIFVTMLCGFRACISNFSEIVL